MRDVMLAMFSVSCFARWGFMCISSAMVVVRVQEVACDAGTFPCVNDVSQLLARFQPYMWGTIEPLPGAGECGTSGTFTSAIDTFPDLPKEEVVSYLGISLAIKKVSLCDSISNYLSFNNKDASSKEVRVTLCCEQRSKPGGLKYCSQQADGLMCKCLCNFLLRLSSFC